MKRIITVILAVLLALPTAIPAPAVSAVSESVLAFPGAEGGGKYSPGARGASSISVYHVTNLNDSGTGSLRDAISKEGRIVVFDVSGTIELQSQLKLNKSNITILGQTAPGDGITLTNYDVLLANGVENVIIRYIRVRPTDNADDEPDGIGGRWNKNVIFDHLSASWSVDELLTLYAGSSESTSYDVGTNLTIQNTIGSESLRMSSHIKGAHGYGAIWGGTNSSYVYNLLAHHDSRSPRLDREIQKTDVRYNVIYDWGQTNSAYGAEPYSYNSVTFTPAYVNWVNNYYKYGPSTASGLRSRLFEVSNTSSSAKSFSEFYFSGNYIWGVGTISNSKSSSYIKNPSYGTLVSTEFDMGDYAATEMSAEEAYSYVLSNAGATLPRRDAIDARIVNDVKNGTGRVINKAYEVGGIIDSDSETEVFAIPSDWLSKNGFSSMEETDIISDTSGEYYGYTVIEAYVNDLTEELSSEEPTNPNIIVQSPAIAAVSGTITAGGASYSVDNGDWTVITEGEPISYKATAIQETGDYTITKMELYDGEDKIKTYDGASSIDDDIYLDAGVHYLTCCAYNSRGEKTQSTTSIVYVNGASAPGSFSYTEIRSSGYAGGYSGKGGASLQSDGTYLVGGSGRIYASTSDNCGFMYKAVEGDFDIIVKVEDIPKFENQQVSGIMVRNSLDSNSVMAMIADGWLKYGENVRVFSRSTAGGKSTETYFSDSSGNTVTNSSGTTYDMPSYMRIQRVGNTLTFSVSDSGTNWTDNVRQPMSTTYSELNDTMYIGIATDSAYGVSTKEYYSIASFSNITINGLDDYAAVTAVPTANELTYTGEAQTLVTAGEASDGTMSYSLDGTVWSGELPTATDAGEYTVYYKAAGNSTHLDSAVYSLSVTINKAAAADVETPRASAVTYGVKLSDITLGGGWEWEDGSIIPTVTNSGYSAYYAVEDYTNYDWSEISGYNGTTHKVVRTIAVSVSRAQSEIITAPTANELTYTGEAQELVTAGESVGGEILYSLDGEEYSTEIPTAADAGEYIVYWKIEESENYSGASGGTITVTIAEVENTLRLDTEDERLVRGKTYTVLYTSPEESPIVLAAFYSGGILVYCRAGVSEITVPESGVTSVKLMLWRDLYSMTPLVGALDFSVE